MISKIVYDTQWVFTISNINGTDSNTVTINKSNFNNKLFAYYNVFSKQVIDREPALNTWDLLFTKYKTLVTLYGQTLMYPVMGVLNHPMMQSAKIMTPEDYQKHLTVIKLVVTSQVLVELIDDLKGTKSYRQDIKYHANNLSSLLEKTLTHSYSNIQDPESEDVYVTIERGFRKLLDTTVEQLHDIGEVQHSV
jgi:hypothetical protein